MKLEQTNKPLYFGQRQSTHFVKRTWQAGMLALSMQVPLLPIAVADANRAPTPSRDHYTRSMRQFPVQAPPWDTANGSNVDDMDTTIDSKEAWQMVIHRKQDAIAQEIEGIQKAIASVKTCIDAGIVPHVIKDFDVMSTWKTLNKSQESAWNEKNKALNALLANVAGLQAQTEDIKAIQSGTLEISNTTLQKSIQDAQTQENTVVQREKKVSDLTQRFQKLQDAWDREAMQTEVPYQKKNQLFQKHYQKSWLGLEQEIAKAQADAQQAGTEATVASMRASLFTRLCADPANQTQILQTIAAENQTQRTETQGKISILQTEVAPLSSAQATFHQLSDKLEQYALLSPDERAQVNAFLPAFSEVQLADLRLKQKKLTNILNAVNAGHPEAMILPTDATGNPIPPNFMIATATIEESPASGSYYMDALYDNQKMTDSLPEAIAQTTHKAFVTHEMSTDDMDTINYEIPVTSLQTVTGWKRSETHPRKILLIAGQNHHEKDDEEGTWFDDELKTIKNRFKELYHLTDKDFIVCLKRDRGEFDRGFAQLKEFCDANKDQNPEVAIIVDSHSGATVAPDGPIKPEDQVLEGSHGGSFWLRGGSGRANIDINKDEMKEKLHMLNNAKSGVLIMLGCEGGYNVAKNKLATPDPLQNNILPVPGFNPSQQRVIV